MELTKEHLDQALAVQRADLSDVISSETGAIRKELKSLETRLSKKIDRVEANLGRRTAKGFEDLGARLDGLVPRVEKLETKMSKVESALNVSL